MPANFQIKSVCLLSMFVILAHAATSLADVEYVQPPMAPGAPLPWHAGVQVSTYSNANTFNGNLFTSIPIVSWSGAGPGVSFALLHNSADWDQAQNDNKTAGFFLGAGWSTSYSARMIVTGTKKVIWPDGTEETFGDPGFHDGWENDPIDYHIWRVWHKDQSFHEFQLFDDDDIARLTRVVDSQGYATIIAYEDKEYDEQPYHRISSITGQGRVLNFVYDDTLTTAPGFLLTSIVNPGIEDLPFPGISSSSRTWYFRYSTDAHDHTWLRAIDDPGGSRISFEYDHSCSPLSPEIVPRVVEFERFSFAISSVSTGYAA